MRQVNYTDTQGRRWAVKLPNDAPDSDASMGIPQGPPSLAALGLPEAIEIALHNQLHARGIFTYTDAKTHPNDLVAAIQGALKLDAGRLLEEVYITS